MAIEDNIQKIKEITLSEKKTAGELSQLFSYYETARDNSEKTMLESQMKKAKAVLEKTNSELLNALEETNVKIPLERAMPEMNMPIPAPSFNTTAFSGDDKQFLSKSEKEMSELDLEVVKRMKKKKTAKIEAKTKETHPYAKFSSGLFSNIVESLIRQKKFKALTEDLIKSNLNYTSIVYISMLLMTTIISIVSAIFLFIFLMLFNISPTLPIITRVTENFGLRFLKIFWILFIAPIGTYAFMYVYPSLEKKSLESKINLELPFAAIHMSAISGSMIDPVKIFSIIASTKEYPILEKEFNKLLNEINVYGYDLVTALKDMAINSPSEKLAELFNGLATTINSGGSLYDYFEKRAQTLLLEYRLEKEKGTKASETFMDIYISVVIAAPMIFMLLLMMMKISGLGVALSTSMITLLVTGGVSMINVFFIVFLQLKQQSTG